MILFEFLLKYLSNNLRSMYHQGYIKKMSKIYFENNGLNA